MNILIVEDEIHLAESLQAILKKHKYQADFVCDGENGLEYALSGVYDLVLLDVMLPIMNGFDVVRRLREEKNNVPVIMLTAKGQKPDKIQGLNFGADDYVTKPFDSDELIARIAALTRRSSGQLDNNILELADLSFHTQNYEIGCKSRSIRVTQKEGEILGYLMRNSDIIIGKEQMIEKIWGFESGAEHNNVEVYVSFLRKKLSKLGAAVEIETIRGIGYKLKASER